MSKIRSGRRRQIRPETAEAVLAVDVSASLLVPADQTWKQLTWLRAHGWTWKELEAATGSRLHTVRWRTHVTRSTAARVEGLYERESERRTVASRVVDVLETYFGSSFTVYEIAERLGDVSANTVQAAISRGLPVPVRSRRVDGTVRYWVSHRSYLSDDTDLVGQTGR